MERITVKAEDGYDMDFASYQPGWSKVVLNRLGEYEDEGTVEEFRALKRMKLSAAQYEAVARDLEEAWDK